MPPVLSPRGSLVSSAPSTSPQNFIVRWDLAVTQGIQTAQQMSTMQLKHQEMALNVERTRQYTETLAMRKEQNDLMNEEHRMRIDQNKILAANTQGAHDWSNANGAEWMGALHTDDLDSIIDIYEDSISTGNMVLGDMTGKQLEAWKAGEITVAGVTTTKGEALNARMLERGLTDLKTATAQEKAKRVNELEVLRLGKDPANIKLANEVEAAQLRDAKDQISLIGDIRDETKQLVLFNAVADQTLKSYQSSNARFEALTKRGVLAGERKEAQFLLGIQDQALEMKRTIFERQFAASNNPSTYLQDEYQSISEDRERNKTLLFHMEGQRAKLWKDLNETPPKKRRDAEFHAKLADYARLETQIEGITERAELYDKDIKTVIDAFKAGVNIPRGPSTTTGRVRTPAGAPTGGTDGTVQNFDSPQDAILGVLGVDDDESPTMRSAPLRRTLTN